MPNNEKNAEPAVRDAQSTAARRRRRRHTPHGDAPAQNPAPRAPPVSYTHLTLPTIRLV